jgi:hypothetical protein
MEQLALNGVPALILIAVRTAPKKSPAREPG